MMLRDQQNILAFDTGFLIMLQQAIRNNDISIHGEFLDYFLPAT